MRVVTRVSNSHVQTWEELRRFVSQDLQAITAVLNGRIGLTDNVQSSLVTAVFPGTGTLRIEHTLGIVPTGYIVVGADAAIQVFDGVGDWSKLDIYLRASGAGTVRLLLF